MQRGIVAALAGCLAFAFTGCDDECQTTRTYFAREVWGSFMSTQCFKCHAPDGVAVTKHNAKFVLQPPTYPGFLDANLANLGEIAKIEYEGTSELLLKPLGKMNHGGGAVLQEDGDEYAALEELVRRLREGDSCDGSGTAADPKRHVELLPPAPTFRKAAIHLAGRLPTAEETGAIEEGGEAALDAALGKLDSEEAFYVRLQEMWNDVLLTDRYRWRGSPVAVQLLNGDDYPAARALRQLWDDGRWEGMTDAQKARLNDAVGREPLDLIRWVVENDLPFTEILTADYVVADEALAKVYAIDDGKTGVRKAQVTDGSGAKLPHAGLLSMPAFLNRYPTTPTNRSRGRARFVLKTFLATDILKVADRPIDVTQVTAKDNPTLNHESCTVCHRVLDPVAGGFRAYDERDYERFRSDRPWHDDMVHPGFGDVDLPSGEYGAALPWLARQMAADPRFDLATVRTTFAAITGRAPLAYPQDGPEFEPRMRAWEAQDAELAGDVKVFRDGGRRLKPLVRAILRGPTYRAVRTTAKDAAALAEVEPFGTARLLTPEMLNRKLVALTGVRWRKPWDWQRAPQDWLDDQGLAQLYGGIDSDQIVDRASALNGVMSNLSWRMASEVACFAVPFEFSKPEAERVLFPKVRAAEVPESAGHAVPGAIAKIRANIRHLHERLLGETLGEKDPEVDATYRLFVETWREGFESGRVQRGLDWPCGLDPNDGTNLPDEVRRDANYTLRAWMAVVTYLLADYRFLFE